MRIRLRRWLAVLMAVCVMLAGNSASAHADGADTDSGNTPIELEITNNVPMFKALSASLEENEGQTFLVMALSGSSFHELFKGTYEQAVANGDGTVSGNDTWIHGYMNDNGKWEFRIPVEEGDGFIPLVAISDPYYNRYLNGQNTLERAFFARCVLLDPDAATLVVADYAFTDPLTVTNTAGKFSVTEVCLKTLGGPNNTQYSCCLHFTIENNPFDRAFIFNGSADEIEEDATAIPAQTDGVFELPVKWAETFESEKTLTNLLNEPFKVFFHSSAEGVWAEFQFTVNEADRTLEIDGFKAVVTKAPEPDENLAPYTGSAQMLVTAGEASGGEMQYVLGTDGTAAPTEGWSTTIPAAADVGTYYVWYKVVGDIGHMDTDPVVISVTIYPDFGEAGFTMPFSLTALELNAFEGVALVASVDASHCASIGAEAFKNCTELTWIRLPKDCEINETAFSGCTKLQFICAPAGGTTEEYCTKMQIMFVPE